MAKDHHHTLSKKYHALFLKLNLVSIIIFAGVVISNISGFSSSIDLFINKLVAYSVHGEIVRIAYVLGNWGEAYFIYIVGVMISLVFIFHCKWRRALVLLVSVTASLGAVVYTKTYFMRVRPENAMELLNNPSFPSGHATLSAAFFTAVMYAFIPQLKSRELRIAFIIWCSAAFILIGLSRIILNVHWFSDVVGGWALGLFIASGSVLLVNKITEIYSDLGNLKR